MLLEFPLFCLEGIIVSWKGNQKIGALEPPSGTTNSVGSQTAAVCNVGAAIVAHVAHSDLSRTNAVICN